MFKENAEPDMIIAEFHIIGSDQSEVSWPVTVPAYRDTAPNEPYVFADATASLVSVAASVMEFVIVVDNHLHPLYTNSLTPYSIVASDRTVRMACRAVWNDTFDTLYDQVKAGTAGSITLTNGGMSTVFDFGTVQVSDVTPNAAKGKNVIDLNMDSVARGSSANAYDIQITNDPVV